MKRWLLALVLLEAALAPVLCHWLHIQYTYYYAYYLALLTSEHQARLQLMELRYAGVSLEPVIFLVAVLSGLGMASSVNRSRLRELVPTPTAPLEAVGRPMGLWGVLTAALYGLLFGIYESSCAGVRWYLGLTYPWHPVLPLARMAVVNTMVVWLTFPLVLAAAMAAAGSWLRACLGAAGWLLALLLFLQTSPLVRFADTAGAALMLVLLGMLHPFFLLILDSSVRRERQLGKP